MQSNPIGKAVLDNVHCASRSCNDSFKQRKEFKLQVKAGSPAVILTLCNIVTSCFYVAINAFSKTRSLILEQV